MSQYVQPPHFCCLPATILHAGVSISFNSGKMASAREPLHFPRRGLHFLQFPLDPCHSQTHPTPLICSDIYVAIATCRAFHTNYLPLTPCLHTSTVNCSYIQTATHPLPHDQHVTSQCARTLMQILSDNCCVCL